MSKITKNEQRLTAILNPASAKPLSHGRVRVSSPGFPWVSNYTLNEDFRVMNHHSTVLETLIEIAFGGVFFAVKSILRIICIDQASSAGVENPP